ncbi:type II secretion system secretin GspD [Endozoicomonas montiporae]|uniref:General secretion pathway protein D n=1 Tax=Endozoicomonas montiporae CL-33 TaxID=570277 RepID=A0A142BAN4_9GAMM|nr:type II secretion system secretin GspD [Endozoicomonas montiporae]AMO55810.1 general secretion pathway protein D [Endozoicomonas montiporae CL-33]
MKMKECYTANFAPKSLLACLLLFSLQGSLNAAPVQSETKVQLQDRSLTKTPSNQQASKPGINSPSVSSSEKKWSLNQQNADIREFIAQIAKITGETFVIDPRIKGGNTVSVISSKPLSSDEVYDVFLEVLSANGYAVIPKGNIINIVPSTTAKTSSPDEATQKPRDAIMTTRVIELHSVSSIELIPIIRPLIAQYGHAAASASSNAVIVSDLADNVERIAKLVKELDEAGNNDYEVLQLKHAWVGDIAKIIQDTLATAKGQLPSGLQVIADERSNRLVIKGNASKRIRVRKLVETLDKQGIRKSTTKVMFLSYADSKNLAEILSEASGTIQDSQEKKGKSSSSAAPAPQPASSAPKVQAKGQPSKSSKNKGQNIFVKADETQNALILIADPETLTEMEHIVRQLDVPRAQVLLEGAIVEVSGDIGDALGIQWGIDGTKTVTSRGEKGESNTLSSVIGSPLANDAKNIPIGTLALRGGNFGVLVTALSKKANSNILSTPSMLTLDNEEAEFQVGKNVPIQTGSYQTSSSGSSSNPFTTTERKDIGIKLKITPHINEGNSIRLELEQEISTLDFSVKDDVDGLVFNSRTIKTTVLVDDSQTVVIGGLIEDESGASKTKVPLLGDIPLLGQLFRSTNVTNKKRNLMLFIRPTIMRNSETLAKATQDRYSKLKMLQSAPGKINNLPEKVDILFDAEAFDLRNQDKAPWQSRD